MTILFDMASFQNSRIKSRKPTTEADTYKASVPAMAVIKVIPANALRTYISLGNLSTKYDCNYFYAKKIELFLEKLTGALKHADNDTGGADEDYYDVISPYYDNLNQALLKFTEKLDSDTGFNTSTYNNYDSTVNIFLRLNQILAELDNDTGATFDNYESTWGLTDSTGGFFLSRSKAADLESPEDIWVQNLGSEAISINYDEGIG